MTRRSHLDHIFKHFSDVRTYPNDMVDPIRLTEHVYRDSTLILEDRCLSRTVIWKVIQSKNLLFRAILCAVSGLSAPPFFLCSLLLKSLRVMWSHTELSSRRQKPSSSLGSVRCARCMLLRIRPTIIGLIQRESCICVEVVLRCVQIKRWSRHNESQQ